ncbi:hypothetical protein D9M71_248890 [compost metagenome]
MPTTFQLMPNSRCHPRYRAIGGEWGGKLGEGGRLNPVSAGGEFAHGIAGLSRALRTWRRVVQLTRVVSVEQPAVASTRKSLRNILPTVDLGSAVRNRTCRGTL